MSDYLRCKAAFIAGLGDGVFRTVNVGALVDATDPVVKGREALFEPVPDVVAKFGVRDKVEAAAWPPAEPVVEDATAEPGVVRRRGPGRPRKVSQADEQAPSEE